VVHCTDLESLRSKRPREFESRLLRILPKVPPDLNTIATNPKGSFVYFAKTTFFGLRSCSTEIFKNMTQIMPIVLMYFTTFLYKPNGENRVHLAQFFVFASTILPLPNFCVLITVIF
jgi:hypothetical protein